MRGLAVVPIFSILSACAIPAQDNRHDPSNLPDVVARIADFTPDSGVCADPSPEFDPASPFSFVEAAPRSHCLAIDGRESVDAGGRVIGTDGDWDFALLGTDGSPVWTRSASNPFFTLSKTDRYGLPVNRALTFRVTVEDRDGYAASAEVPFVALNSRPTAVAGHRLSLPVGGPPWAAGAPIEVPLDGTRSSDPEGDPLLLEWTLPDGAVIEATVDDAVTAAVPVTAPGRFLARLRVSDGAEWSASTSAVVQVEPPDIFVTSGVFTSRPLQRIDGSASIMGYAVDPGVLGTVTVSVAQAGDLVLALYSSYDGVDSYSYLTLGDPSVGGGMPAGLEVAALSLQETGVLAGSVDGLAASMVDAGSSTIRRFDLSSGTPVEIGSGVSMSPFGPFGPFTMTLDETGATWIGGPAAEYNAGLLGHLSSSGTFTMLSTNDRIGIESIAVRPESNEVWIATLPNGGNSPTPLAPGLRVHDAANPVASPVTIDVGATGATGLAWVDHERVWLTRPGDGARLADAALLAGGSGVEAATILHVLGAQTLRDLHLDRETGDLRGRSISPDTGDFVLYVVSTQGEVSARSNPLNGVPPAIDRAGLFLEPSSGALWRSKGAAASGLVQDLHLVSSPAGGGYDVQTGGLWMVSSDPTCLLRFAADGAVTSAVTTIVEDGASRAFPDLASFDLSPDGTRVFANRGTFGEEGLFRFDLTVSPPVATQVDPGENEWSLIRPSAPFPASTPFVWARSNADNSIVKFPDDSVNPAPTPVFTPGISESIPDMDLAVGSNDLCAVVVSVAAFPDVSVDLLRFHPDGSMTVLDTIVTADYALAGTAGGWGGVDDVCWFFLGLLDNGTDGHVRVLSYLPDGTLRNDEDLFDLGRPVDMLALSERRSFVLTRQMTPFESDRTTAIDVIPGTPGSLSATTFYPSLNTGGIGYASYIRF